MSNKYIYRYDQFVIKKTKDDGYVVVNLNASYECHSHVKSIQAGKALCKLAAKRKVPRNQDLYFIESLIRLTNNKKFLTELKQLKQAIENNEFINNNRIKNQKENVKKIIDDGIDEFYEDKSEDD